MQNENPELDRDTVEHLVALRKDSPLRRFTVRARILELLERRIAKQGECVCDLLLLRDFVLAEQSNDKCGDA